MKQKKPITIKKVKKIAKKVAKKAINKKMRSHDRIMHGVNSDK